MIGFIGSGFNPPQSLTKEEIDFMRNSELILVDTYTSPHFLKEFENRNLVFADREKLEDFSWVLREKGNVSIIIPGDPFSATTHFLIYMEAIRAGLEVKVFHNASIYPSAATRMGLHLYKVGSAVSLPRFADNFKPTSPYEKILENLRRGMHTILLLDTNPPMKLGEALEELEWMEKEMKGGLFAKDKEVGVVNALGSGREKIAFGHIDDIRSWTEGTPPFTIVIPGSLHFQEQEALELYRI